MTVVKSWQIVVVAAVKLSCPKLNPLGKTHEDAQTPPPQMTCVHQVMNLIPFVRLKNGYFCLFFVKWNKQAKRVIDLVIRTPHKLLKTWMTSRVRDVIIIMRNKSRNITTRTHLHTNPTTHTIRKLIHQCNFDAIGPVGGCDRECVCDVCDAMPNQQGAICSLSQRRRNDKLFARILLAHTRKWRIDLILDAYSFKTQIIIISHFWSLIY